MPVKCINTSFSPLSEIFHFRKLQIHIPLPSGGMKRNNGRRESVIRPADSPLSLGTLVRQQNFNGELQTPPMQPFIPFPNKHTFKMRTMNARSIQCLAAVKFNGRDSYLESRMLKVGIFPSLSAPVGSEGKREQWSTFLLEIKPNCPFSLVVPKIFRSPLGGEVGC